MKIMALDTSGKSVSAAVAEDGCLMSHIWFRHGKTHAETLMPCIEATLSGLEIKLSEIDVFAVVSGPGSFTGLRIGISTIKALAYANKKPVAGIPTHDALAKNLEDCGDTLICPVIGANKDLIYQAVYLCRGAAGPTAGTKTIRRITDAALVSTSEALERLRFAFAGFPGIDKVIFNGDAAIDCLDYFCSGLGEQRCMVANEAAMLQNASSAALLAFTEADNNLLIAPELLAPLYYNAGYAKIGV